MATARILFRSQHKYHFFLYAPILVALASINLAVKEMFGQREHIFVLLYMPFFLLRCFRYQGETFRTIPTVVVGVLAGIGVCLKPHFALIVAAVEGFLLFYKRTRPIKFSCHPEVAAVGSIAGLYLLHFLFFTQSMRQGYFSVLVPLYLEGYDFWNTTTIFMLANPGIKLSAQLALVLCLAPVLIRREQRLLVPLSLFTLLSLSVYVLQEKGWWYQSIPMQSGSYFLLSILAALFISFIAKFVKLRRTLMINALLIVCCATMIWQIQNAFYSTLAKPRFNMAMVGCLGTCPDEDIGPIAKTVLKYSQVGDPILFIANGVYPGFPATLQTNREPASRHLNAIVLSLLDQIKRKKRSPERARLLSYEDVVIDQLGKDIAANKPQLIFIQNQPIFRYLEPYRFMETAMKDYQLVDHVEDLTVYARADTDKSP